MHAWVKPKLDPRAEAAGTKVPAALDSRAAAVTYNGSKLARAERFN